MTKALRQIQGTHRSLNSPAQYHRLMISHLLIPIMKRQEAFLAQLLFGFFLANTRHRQVSSTC